jgi:hypothetical protein
MNFILQEANVLKNKVCKEFAFLLNLLSLPPRDSRHHLQESQVAAERVDVVLAVAEEVLDEVSVGQSRLLHSTNPPEHRNVPHGREDLAVAGLLFLAVLQPTPFQTVFDLRGLDPKEKGCLLDLQLLGRYRSRRRRHLRRRRSAENDRIMF